MEDVLQLILKSLYFFLPAYFANMSPVLVQKVPFLERAIWPKYLGDHKTWRGLIAGTLMGGMIFALQRYVHMQGFQNWAVIDYADFSVLLGFLMGAGALLGDMIKSYYKRKAEIAPGCRWIPFDQLDFVIGGIAIGCFIYVPPAEVVLVLLIVSPLLHILFNHLGFWLKIREQKW